MKISNDRRDMGAGHACPACTLQLHIPAALLIADEYLRVKHMWQRTYCNGNDRTRLDGRVDDADVRVPH